MKTRVLLVFWVAVLSGCATNDFTKFYRESAAITKVATQNLIPFSGKTEIYSTNDLPKDVAELSKRGYIILGESAFQGAGKTTEEQIKEQAKTIGADVVLYKNEYQGSEQTAFPLVQYNPGQTSTTYSSGNANATARSGGVSAYGNANYSGTSTTTTSGTYSTTMVPVTLQRYAHNALYFRKGKPPIMGVFPDNMTDEMRIALKRNTGALIKVVMYDTPAFRSNMFPGDIIILIEKTPIESAQDFLNKVGDFAGKECNVTILREGTEKIIPIKMNPKAP